MSPYVLFVDDEESNLIVWEAASANRWPVKVARSGEEALQILGRHEVAVVLADQRMPRMTGVELLEKVRYRHPDTVRILITAYSDIDAAVDAINRGQVRRYLRKPCPLPELFGEIEEAMDLYDLRGRVRLLERRVVLTERVYALGVIASGLGRELERPATWIKDSVTLARREIAIVAAELEAQGANVGVLRHRLAELRESLDRALNGVERVLDLAYSVSLPMPRKETDAAGVDLAEVLRLVLRVARGEFREHVEVALDVHPVPRVPGSAAQLGQVALTLLIQAFDAVRRKTDDGRLISVGLRYDGDAVRLEVFDNAPALPDSEMSRLCDPLYVSKERMTSGLGLAVAKAIVEDLGGRLDVTGARDRGTLLRVSLPIYDEPRACKGALAPRQMNADLGADADIARNLDRAPQ